MHTHTLKNIKTHNQEKFGFRKEYMSKLWTAIKG